MTPDSVTVVNNPAENRFEAEVDGKLAVAEYRLRNGNMEFVHTDVPRELEGRGIASQLARAALDHAREQKLGVVARCPFFSAWIAQHQEYQDLLREAP